MKKSINIGVFDPKLIMQASPYCGDQIFAKGLEANGYEVTRFDYREVTDPNNKLLDLANEIKPDLFWFGKCERISPETIGILKRRFPESIFCKWCADVRAEPTVHDLGHNQYMTWFFGTFGGDYLQKHLLPSMKGVASIIAFTDSDFYHKMDVSDEYKSDILWSGRKGFGDNPLRNEIIDHLSKTKQYKVKIAGINDWLGDPEYQYYINGTKIGVGANSFNRTKYSSDRLGNYMACGTFYLPHYFEGIEKVFKRGIEIDWFESIEELMTKIDYYLKHEDERKKIAEQGQKFILRHFDCKPLLANLLNIIKTRVSEYSWDEVYVN